LLIRILFGLSILFFFWVGALPGSPISSLLGERATPQLVAQYKHRYCLDEPIYKQYVKQLHPWPHADCGTAIATHRTITYEIKQRFPATVELAVAAMIFAIGIGLPLGFFAAKKYGQLFDHPATFIPLIGPCNPAFFPA